MTTIFVSPHVIRMLNECSQVAFIASTVLLASLAFLRLAGYIRSRKMHFSYGLYDSDMLVGLVAGLLAVSTSVYFGSRLVLPGHPLNHIQVSLHSHLTFERTAKQWKLNSALSVDPENPESLSDFSESLRSQGWIILSGRFPLEPLFAEKTSSFQEQLSWWRLSHSEHIPIIEAYPDGTQVTLAKNSDLLIDAPNGLVIDTFPATAGREPLITDQNLIRMHVPLQFAFDETPHLNMRTSTLTIWGRALLSMQWLFGKGLKWFIGIVVTALAGIVTAWLTGLFQKKSNKITPGFKGGVESLNPRK